MSTCKFCHSVIFVGSDDSMIIQSASTHQECRYPAQRETYYIHRICFNEAAKNFGAAFTPQLKLKRCVRNNHKLIFTNTKEN